MTEKQKLDREWQKISQVNQFESLLNDSNYHSCILFQSTKAIH